LGRRTGAKVQTAASRRLEQSASTVADGGRVSELL
jgi:hypothetical protein